MTSDKDKDEFEQVIWTAIDLGASNVRFAVMDSNTKKKGSFAEQVLKRSYRKNLFHFMFASFQFLCKDLQVLSRFYRVSPLWKEAAESSAWNWQTLLGMSFLVRIF